MTLTIEILSITEKIITLLGVPIAIFLFYKEKQRERIDREYGTYNALDEKYSDFLKICLDNIELGLYDSLNQTQRELSQDQQIKRDIIYEILVCLFEKAFLMYKSQNKDVKKRQWTGWEAYISDWMEVDSFRSSWNSKLNSQYDEEFLKYMNGVYKQKLVN